MADSTRLITGLPNLPNNELEKQLYSELSIVYRAIQNLTQLVGQYTGIDAPGLSEIAAMDPASYLLGSNLGRYYPTVSVVGGVTRGQIVHLNGGNTINKAIATSSAGLAIGIANETAANGANCEVLTGFGLTDAIGGMTPGTLYYLSTTLGAIQNLRPVGAGQIIQPIGWALTSTQMLYNINPYYQQL